ncbi:MAG: elongation factor Ts, partial [Caldilinea sp.]
DANEGLIGSYVHPGSKVASIVEVNCETDFVARTDEFQQLARDLAMHVTAARPLWVAREDVPADVVAKEREVYTEQMANSGKPDQVVERIVEGKLDKWYSEVCLLEQSFIKEPDVSIKDLLTNRIASLGENIKVRRFCRLEIGAE